MAKIISFEDVARERRRTLERETVERCVEIVRLNLNLALHHLAVGPEDERAVRARQIRQLGELLEYMIPS